MNSDAPELIEKDGMPAKFSPFEIPAGPTLNVLRLHQFSSEMNRVRQIEAA
jgi:hypothetical protein